MKKLTLFLTLSLLTIIGTSTLVKAEKPGDAVTIPSDTQVDDSLEQEAAETEVMDKEAAAVEEDSSTDADTAAAAAEDAPTDAAE